MSKGCGSACTRTPTRGQIRIYTLWKPDSKECGFSVRIRLVRVDERSIQRHFSPDSGKLDSVSTRPRTLTLTLTLTRPRKANIKVLTMRHMLTHAHTHTHSHSHTHSHTQN